MIPQTPLLLPFFQTRWIPFILSENVSLSSSLQPLSPMIVTGSKMAPLATGNQGDKFSSRDYGAFAVELEFPAGEEDAETVAFTGPSTVLPSDAQYYGLCSMDPIALVTLTSGFQPGDELGLSGGVLSADGTGFVFLSYTASGVALIRRQGGATQRWYIGKVKTSAIAADSTGTVEQHEYDWQATGTEFTVYNPHDIELPVGWKVRWTKYPLWINCGDPETDWIVEPWQYTECPPDSEQ